MNIKFGTIRDFFDYIPKVESKLRKINGQEKAFPVLSGVFFPYSDYENDTWTGYYTTWNWLKRFTREIELLIRAADVFSVSAFHQCRKPKTVFAEFSKSYKGNMGRLRNARRDVGMFQHHVCCLRRRGAAYQRVPKGAGSVGLRAQSLAREGICTLNDGTETQLRQGESKITALVERTEMSG
ncbi:hypothetical protein DPMN_020178 [Dreissena polymorpha]|uniref:Glycoside hydrolase family 38 central domain-containing protein n=1 Tax=Dreissena polymorpha TaxID=45954 RepID=A0A9D4NM73_DREPO|nr:hypothetical protein DPMN_020178 [Dreissena polymorpha]